MEDERRTVPSTYPLSSGYRRFSALGRNPWSSWCDIDSSSHFLRLRPFQNNNDELGGRFGGKDLKQKKEEEGIAGLKNIWEIRDFWRDSIFSFFKSSADVIAMMTLKRVVTSTPLTKKNPSCMNPSNSKWRQPTCACQWDWLSDSLANNSEHWIHKDTQRSLPSPQLPLFVL